MHVRAVHSPKSANLLKVSPTVMWKLFFLNFFGLELGEPCTGGPLDFAHPAHAIVRPLVASRVSSTVWLNRDWPLTTDRWMCRVLSCRHSRGCVYVYFKFIHIRLLVQQLTKRNFAVIAKINWDGDRSDRTKKKVNVMYINNQILELGQLHNTIPHRHVKSVANSVSLIVSGPPYN